MNRLLSLAFSLFFVLVAAAQDGIPEDHLYFTVTASRSSVYEQEAVLLTYTFHARGTMGLSVGMNSKPDFEGLVSQEIPQPTNKTIYTETVNGHVQRAGVVKQSLVFPQRAGRVTVPGITFNCEVSAGDGMIGALVKTKRRVPDITLDVRPLPKPAPASFRGAVGQFEAKSSLVASQVMTGDIASRIVTVSGKGNLRLITPPAIRFPDAFDVFDTTVEDNVHVTAEGMSGSVRYNYPFMPRRTGSFVLPADTFCYFDPQAGEYRTLLLEASAIKVSQGHRSAEEIEAEAELRRADIRPDHTDAAASFATGWGLWLWLAGVGALLGLFVVADRMLSRAARRRSVLRGVAGAGKRAEEGLQRVASLLDNNDTIAALAALETTLTDLALEYVPSASSADHHVMADALLVKGFGSEPVHEWLALLSEIGRLRFSPLSNDADQGRALWQRAVALLPRLVQNP
ncbi:MAG: protein BatD [Bacteroidaceae bacterium]|nr:protein BatD [Bacteroidaceae bacterium]